MRRRSFLGLAAFASAAGLAGCTATAIPGADAPATATPNRECPAVLDAEQRVCPRQPDGPLAVERSTDRVTGRPLSVAVTVLNEASTTYRFDPYGWSVFRRADADWHRVVADTGGIPRRAIAPGEQFTWQLTGTEPDLSDADQRVFLDLGSGEYAFAVPFAGPASVVAVAPFQVAG